MLSTGLATLAAPSRWAPTADCAGVPVGDVCWVLGGPGQSCPDMCSGSALVDRQTTLDGSSSREVVTALTVRYGLPPWRRAQSLDRPCVASTFDTASFLYLHEAQQHGQSAVLVRPSPATAASRDCT